MTTLHHTATITGRTGTGIGTGTGTAPATLLAFPGGNSVREISLLRQHKPWGGLSWNTGPGEARRGQCPFMADTGVQHSQTQTPAQRTAKTGAYLKSGNTHSLALRPAPRKMGSKGRKLLFFLSMPSLRGAGIGQCT